MLSIYLLFAVLVLCSASEGLTTKKFKPLSADTPLSFNSVDDRFAARISLVGAFSFGLWSGAWFHSLQLELTNDTAVGDYIWGALYVGTGFYPVNYLSYFSADVQTHRDPPADPSKYDWGNFTVDTASGFVASTFLHLVEKDPNGHPVLDRPLSTLLWTYDAASSAGQTNSSAGIWVAVFQGKTLIPSALRVTLTYVMTNSAGTLNTNTKPLITPKAIESWIQIQDWPFDSTNNTLSLIMAVGSGSATFSASGSVASGSGSEQVYFRAADSVYVDGEIKKILQVNASASGNGIAGFQNDGVVAQLEARYKASASVTLVEIKFPYGKFIEYDPTVGAGPDPYQDGANVGLIVGVVIGTVLFLVAVVIIVYFVFGKRADYKSVA